MDKNFPSCPFVSFVDKLINRRTTMYTMSQIRNRVNAPKRKYATELKILKVFPIAEEFSLG